MRDRLVRCFAGPPVKITVNMYIKSIGPVSETDEVRHFAPSPPPISRHFWSKINVVFCSPGARDPTLKVGHEFQAQFDLLGRFLAARAPCPVAQLHFLWQCILTLETAPRSASEIYCPSSKPSPCHIYWDF
jgi:hypothetical protein